MLDYPPTPESQHGSQSRKGFLQVVFSVVLMSLIIGQSLAQPQQSPIIVQNTFRCALIEVASQFKTHQFSENLHCADDSGKSYALKNMPANLLSEYLTTIKKIEYKLQELIVNHSNLNTNDDLTNALQTAKLQLQAVSRPQLIINNFYQTTDTIRPTDAFTWRVVAELNAIETAYNRLSADASSQIFGGGTGSNIRTVLVVHVTANDYSTTADPNALSDAVFGTAVDVVNLSSQFTACSFGQLTFVPTEGNHINDGVVQLTIDMNVEGVSRGTVRNAVLDAGNALFGSLFDQADHVMFALPPNTDGGWIAYATVNGKSSVYNDDWATFVSAQMHEIGHNLGMAHSGEGDNAYADQSGMMGYSYGNNEGPQMCFNAAKSSKFGWYINKERSFDESFWPNGQVSWNGKVIGMADFAQVASDQNVLLKIRREAGNNDNKTLNINFNSKIGINNGTQEGGDHLMVVETKTPTAYNTSTLLTKLDSGESHTFENYWLSNTDLIITVNDILTDSNGAQYADIEIKINDNNADYIFSDGFSQ